MLHCCFFNCKCISRSAEASRHMQRQAMMQKALKTSVTLQCRPCADWLGRLCFMDTHDFDFQLPCTVRQMSSKHFLLPCAVTQMSSKHFLLPCAVRQMSSKDLLLPCAVRQMSSKHFLLPCAVRQMSSKHACLGCSSYLGLGPPLLRVP